MARKDSGEMMYRLMLSNVSWEIQRRNISLDMLKFALFDLVTNKRKLQAATNSFDIFLELDNSGSISPSDISVLNALIELLGVAALKDVITESDFPTPDVQPSDKFSAFCISTVNFGNTLNESKIQRIAGVYKVPQEQSINQWKLLQYLRDENILYDRNLTELAHVAGINIEQIQVQSSSEGSTERTEALEREFRNFLSKISGEYPGVHYKWLRFLLFDHLPIQILQTDTTVGMLLFNTLSLQGDISYTNIIILSEIAKLTNLMSAKKLIAEYKKCVRCKEGQVLTAYRKTLFCALRQVAEDELPMLIAVYNLFAFSDKFRDIWDFVLYLEIQKYLDDTEEKWQRFAGFLNETAKKIMLEKSKAETLKEAVEAAKEVEQEAAKLVAAAKVVVDKAVIEATTTGAEKTKLAKEKNKAVAQAELAAKNTEEKAASLKRRFTELKD